MKKKLFMVVFGFVFAFIASYGFYVSNNDQGYLDITVDNIEALAFPETGDYNTCTSRGCVFDTRFDCKVSFLGNPMYICYYMRPNYLNV